MSEAEMAGGQSQWIASKHEPRPRTRKARKHNWIDSRALVHGLRCTNDSRIGRCAGGIVSASHVHLDVAVAMFCQVCFEQLQRLGGGHIGNKTAIQLGD